MIAGLLCFTSLKQPDVGYASLPQVRSPNPYSILTEDAQLTIGTDNLVRISTVTVYRNQGAGTQATVSFADGFLSGKSKSSLIVATWDNKPVAFQTSTTGNGETVSTATVTMGKDATHALRLAIKGVLSRKGYSKDEYGFRYVLAGTHPIDLFSLSFRYESGSVFGLPTVKPDFGWEIGDVGASIRKVNFSPADTDASIQFYRNEMRPLGKES